MTANKQPRSRISWTSLRAPNPALILAVAFVTTVVTMPAQAKIKVLYTFTGGADGGYPAGSLIEDAKGNLYGTAELGGNLNCAPPGGCGTVFELTTAGKFILLHTFAGGTDGASPYAALLMDAAGNLYGTTSAGGGASGCFGNGCGTVFKIDPKGTETVLYSFQGKADGGLPYSTLIMDKAGNFYGTTFVGGDLSCSLSSSGCGTVFKLTNTGKETVLYSFTGGTDGAYPPDEALAVDSTGNFYGTTSRGGDLSCSPPDGCGTVFKLAKTGKQTVLHAFTGAAAGPAAADGELPESGPILIDGYLYGTTVAGGAFGLGTVYSIKLAGDVFKTLHSAEGGPNDGARPYAAPANAAQAYAAPNSDAGGDALLYILYGLGAHDYGDFVEEKGEYYHELAAFEYEVTGGSPLGQALDSAARDSIVFTLSQGGSTTQGPGAGTLAACPKTKCK